MDLLNAEAAGLAAFLAGIARGAETVRDPVTGAVRPSRAGDVLVLARRLTRVSASRRRSRRSSLRFTVEGGKSFFDRQEVHETLAVLRAVDDPQDRIALVAALRSSFFGVSDRDVVAYSLSGGPLWAGAIDEDRPGAAALAPAVALLDELHRVRRHASVPALLERLYDETRVLAALTGSRRGEAQIANLEKVTALAREASSLGALTLRGFANLLEDRIAERARGAGPSLDTPRRPRHRARPLDPQGEGPRGAGGGPLRHRRRRLLADHHGAALGGGADRDRLPRGLPAPGLGRPRAAGGEEGAGGVAPAPLRGLHARARPADRPPAADGRRRGRVLEGARRPAAAASDADVRVVDVEGVPRAEVGGRGRELWAIANAEGGDAVAARWTAERKELVARAGERELAPVSATRLAARTAPPPAAAAGGAGDATSGASCTASSSGCPSRTWTRDARSASARWPRRWRPPSASTPRPPGGPRPRSSGRSPCP